jgi:ubiquinone/menaquinone biosynthesis C-methylase UbiE
MINQEKVTTYYDGFSIVYDLISSKRYYHKPRKYAIELLNLQKHQTILNLPCGTGQNFSFFQKHLNETGQIIGIDLSRGMLKKAEQKVKQNNWQNVKIIKGDATKIDATWIKDHLGEIKINAVLCDLGLSGFPKWQQVIDNLIAILEPNGKIVIMDWYIEKPSFRGKFINWIGKGEVNRPISQYLQSQVSDFEVNHSFKKGDVFVASGIKKC